MGVRGGRERINYVRQWPYFPQPGVTVEKDKRYSKARHTEERQGDRDKTHQQYSKLYFIDYETLYFSGAVLLLKGLFTKKMCYRLNLMFWIEMDHIGRRGV